MHLINFLKRQKLIRLGSVNTSARSANRYVDVFGIVRSTHACGTWPGKNTRERFKSLADITRACVKESVFVFWKVSLFNSVSRRRARMFEDLSSRCTTWCWLIGIHSSYRCVYLPRYPAWKNIDPGTVVRKCTRNVLLSFFPSFLKRTMAVVIHRAYCFQLLWLFIHGRYENCGLRRNVGRVYCLSISECHAWN